MSLTHLEPVPANSEFADLDAAAVAYAQRLEAEGETGRERLRENMIRTCLPLAARLASRYRGRGEHSEDLEQVARLGLVKAVDRYRPERGSFTAYAVPTVTGEIKKHFRDRTWGVHVPRSMHDLVLEVRRTAGILAQRDGREATHEQVAQSLGIAVADVRHALETAAGYAPASLNAPAGADSTTERGDLFGSPDPEMEQLDDRITASGLIMRLPARERRILALRYYGNRTQSQIAAEIGISQMHVSRIISRALTWLREGMLSDSVPRWDGAERDTHKVAVSRRRGRGVLTAEVKGEIDRDTAGQLRIALRQAVHDAAPDGVVVDLAGVPFLDAAGAAVLFDAATAASVAGIGFRITGATPIVATVLGASGLTRCLAGPAGRGA